MGAGDIGNPIEVLSKDTNEEALSTQFSLTFERTCQGKHTLVEVLSDFLLLASYEAAQDEIFSAFLSVLEGQKVVKELRSVEEGADLDTEGILNNDFLVQCQLCLLKDTEDKGEDLLLETVVVG